MLRPGRLFKNSRSKFGVDVSVTEVGRGRQIERSMTMLNDDLLQTGLKRPATCASSFDVLSPFEPWTCCLPLSLGHVVSL